MSNWHYNRSRDWGTALVPAGAKAPPSFLQVSISEISALAPLPDRREHLDWLCKEISDAGVVLEFGVYRGTSLRRIASNLGPGRRIIGLDSFRGLPKAWYTSSRETTGHPRGWFETTSLPIVPDDAIILMGTFTNTTPILESYLEQPGNEISLLHIDSDLYESAVLALHAARHGIRHGTVIAFDELCNWDGRYPLWEEGEWRAFNEFLDRYKGIRAIPLSRSAAQQAAFRIEIDGDPRALPPPASHA